MFYVSFCFVCLTVADPGFPRYQFLGINSRNPSDGVDHNLINGPKVNVGLTGEALNYYNLSIWDKLHNISMVTKGHRDICFKIEKQNATCQMPRVPRETEGIFVFRQCYEKFQCCILREVQPGAERTTRLELPVLFLPELYQTNLRAHGPHYQTASSLL